MNINYDDLTIQSLSINDEVISKDQAFATSKADIFPSEFAGDINYSILQDGTSIHEKLLSNPTDFGSKDSQMAEFGTWLNRRFVSTNLTNSAPVEKYFTGVEFTNWHNRVKLTFHVRPTADITDGQLQFSVEVPAIYSNRLNNGEVYGFADDQNRGFAARGGKASNTLTVSNNTITATTAAEDLIAGTSYSISIILHAATADLSTTYTGFHLAETPVTISTNQTAPDANNQPTISYDEDEGIHFLNTPRYAMGYRNCNQGDILQNIELTLTNDSNLAKTTRLCFRQIPNTNVVGFNSIIRNENGDPSGFPLQVSKNWHTTTAQLFSGSWIREYTEIIIPANTTLNIDYTRTGAEWGETYAASSHQLSVVGAGVPKGGWLEAALGSFGETVTHSPDYLFGNSNVCDYRPFLVTNEAYQGTSAECNWTGNVGGMDMWIYVNDSGQRIYQKETKTRFQRYSPNLTETSISAISSDEKLKLDYTFYLNRSDDFVRVYYKIKVKALANTPFNRFDVFQLGGDRYNLHSARAVKFGNESGVLGELTPTNNGSNNYTTDEIDMSGNRPWIWAGDGLYTRGYGGINIDANTGMIVNAYSAQIGGAPANTPYFRERSSSQGFSSSSGLNPTSYCIVTPPGTTQLMEGDSIELIVESVILPKMAGDYYGPNSNFDNALTLHGNSVDLFLREVQGNAVQISSDRSTVDSNYPYTVSTVNNTAQIEMTGGKGYVPIIFSDLTNIENPKLWKATDNCWEIVDQSVHGNDFWQANFQAESGTYDLVYNVNQDTQNDSTETVHYYLGNTSPIAVVGPQSNLNNLGWTTTDDLRIHLGDSLQFAPTMSENGSTSLDRDGAWSWTGPNGFSASSKDISIDSITTDDFGTYSVTYTSPIGCVVMHNFEIQCAGQTEVIYDGLDNDCDPTTLDDDLDQDGFINEDDCDDTDPLINPDAIEIPGNGIDENCDGFDFVSSSDELAGFNIDIFPNPAQEVINIRIDGKSNYQTSLFNLDGKLIKVIESGSVISIRETPSGIYILEVKDTRTGKHIVEKVTVNR